MAGDDNRIAERLKEVEEETDDDRQGRGMTDEEDDLGDEDITISAGEDAGDVALETDGPALDDAIEEVSPDSDSSGDEGVSEGPMNDEMSIAEQLGTAADFEKRATQLRREAITTTEERLAACFEQEVDVVLDPQGDGSLTGKIRIPELEVELDRALDENTGIDVEHISVTVGDGESDRDGT